MNCCSSTMANIFNWIRPGFELVSAKLEWNVQVPFLQTRVRSDEQIPSPFFSSQETPEDKWSLNLFDESPKLSMCAFRFSHFGQCTKIIDPVLVKISILDGKGRKIFQQMLPSKPNYKYVEFFQTKQDIVQSKCQQADGSCTFCCKIYSHVKKEPVVLAIPPAVDCSGELIIQLEELFDGMKFSDVIFNVGGREFPAHKSILSARSEVFAAMFHHPTKENLTNLITIEDVKPEVLQELLRFIYTGRLSATTMETMAVRLMIAADKYLLFKLKNECEKYLLRHQMSPVNCVELLLHGDLLNPAEHLKEAMKEAAKIFRRSPSQMMTTAEWEKMEEVNPKKLFKIQKILFNKK